MMKTIFTLLAIFTFAGTAVAAPQSNALDAMYAAVSKYPNTGKVTEVIQTSMYTYMQVSGGQGSIWLAASKNKVEKGNNIGFGSGATMKNFHSKSLNRTFDTIIFLDKVEVLK